MSESHFGLKASRTQGLATVDKTTRRSKLAATLCDDAR